MKKTYLVVAAADEEEISSLFTGKTNYKKLENDVYLYECEKYTVIAMTSGIGKVAMAYRLGRMLASFQIDEIINVGVAGSISSQLKPFDTLVATSVAYNDVDVVDFGYHKYQMCGMPLYFVPDEDGVKKALSLNNNRIKPGLILSGDSFISKRNLPSSFYEDFDNPVAVDMESAAVGQVAYMAKVPFMIIRSISDDASGNETNKEQYDYNVAEAAKRAYQIVWQIID
jgi:adenosylhomocysteine nucleosidase